MATSDMNTGPRDITQEVGAGDGTGGAFDHEVPGDGTVRRTSSYEGFGKKVANRLKSALKNNSADR